MADQETQIAIENQQLELWQHRSWPTFWPISFAGPAGYGRLACQRAHQLKIMSTLEALQLSETKVSDLFQHKRERAIRDLAAHSIPPPKGSREPSCKQLLLNVNSTHTPTPRRLVRSADIGPIRSRVDALDRPRLQFLRPGCFPQAAGQLEHRVGDVHAECLALFPVPPPDP